MDKVSKIFLAATGVMTVVYWIAVVLTGSLWVALGLGLMAWILAFFLMIPC